MWGSTASPVFTLPSVFGMYVAVAVGDGDVMLYDACTSRCLYLSRDVFRTPCSGMRTRAWDLDLNLFLLCPEHSFGQRGFVMN